MKFDVFISYASPDRDAIVRPFAEALKAKGYRVWFDEFELRPGDRLSETIDYGMANSFCGVVVLSRSFISRPWPKREFSGLTALALAQSRKLVPMLHELEPIDLLSFSPVLADVKCLRSSDGIAANISLIRTILPTPSRHTFAFEDAFRDIEVGSYDTALLSAGRALDERLFSVWSTSAQSKDTFITHPMEALFVLYQSGEVVLEDAEGSISVELLENCFLAQGITFFFRKSDPVAITNSVRSAQRFLRANPMKNDPGPELPGFYDRHFWEFDRRRIPTGESDA